MTFEELCALVPAVLSEMTAEFLRKANEHLEKRPTSQYSACSLLVLRGVSILRGMQQLLKPDTFDSWDVLTRAFMETHNLLMTFRFDDDDTRKRVGAWFADRGKDTWQAKHKEVELFLSRVGANDLQLARLWGIFSGLAHPTAKAAMNSASLLSWTITPASARSDLSQVLRNKRADYCDSLGRLFITATYDLDGWVDLGFDISRMPSGETFRMLAPEIVMPILGQQSDGQQKVNPRRGRR
jgi:hypothetical protein